jgi:hypothetical protein
LVVFIELRHRFAVAAHDVDAVEAHGGAGMTARQKAVVSVPGMTGRFRDGQLDGLRHGKLRSGEGRHHGTLSEITTAGDAPCVRVRAHKRRACCTCMPLPAVMIVLFDTAASHGVASQVPRKAPNGVTRIQRAGCISKHVQ